MAILIPACLFLVLFAPGSQAHPQTPETGFPDDALDARRQRLEKQLAEVEARNRETETACRKLRARSRFLAGTNGITLPPLPGRDRVVVLGQETAILHRAEILQRRLLAFAVDRDLILRSALSHASAAVEQRIRQPRPERGPLARRDRLLPRLQETVTWLHQRLAAAEQAAEQRQRELDTFLDRKRHAETLMEEAERAWQAEQQREALDRDRQKKELAKDRQALIDRWKVLLQHRESLTRADSEATARLRAALLAPSGPEETEGKPSPAAGAGTLLDEVETNATSRAAFRSVMAERIELANVAARLSDHHRTEADYFTAWNRYLDGCRHADIRLPELPELDPRANLEAVGLALQASQAQATRQASLLQDNERTLGLIDLQEQEARTLRARYLQSADLGTLFPPPRGETVIEPPVLPEDPSPALQQADRTASDAIQAHRSLQRALIELRHQAYSVLQQALDAAEKASMHGHLDPAHREALERFAAARTDLARLQQTYQERLADLRSSVRTRDARLAELTRLIAGHRPPEPRDWRWRLKHVWHPEMVRRTDRLPASEVLVAVAIVLLGLGVFCHRSRRQRVLMITARMVCLVASLGLAGTGLVRGDPWGWALAATGALAALVAAWAIPANLWAGWQLGLGGRGRKGDLIWNDVVRGRLVRRGLFRSTLDVGNPHGSHRIRMSNRWLVRSRYPIPVAARKTTPFPATGRTDGPADRPEEGQLRFRVSLASDWIAVRQLVQTVARGHDRKAEVRFHVHDDAIHLTLHLERPAHEDEIRDRVAAALDAAPFAERLPEA